jgi:hypothetical protein
MDWENMKLTVFVVILSIAPFVATTKLQRVMKLDQEFTLKVGQSARSEDAGLKFTFASVKEESRCPKGVTCVWSGNAKILIDISKDDGGSTTFELNTNIKPKSGRYVGYELSLEKLEPYPKGDEQLKPSQYEATLILRKLKP